MKIKEETILKKAIQKAEKNGMKKYRGCDEKQFENFFNNLDNNLEYLMKYGGYITFIFDHDFTKAFWGEDTKECVECNRLPEQRFTRDMIGSKYTEKCEDERHSYRNIDNWKTHLQTMVLEENPIKYLEKFLTN